MCLRNLNCDVSYSLSGVNAAFFAFVISKEFSPQEGSDPFRALRPWIFSGLYEHEYLFDVFIFVSHLAFIFGARLSKKSGVEYTALQTLCYGGLIEEWKRYVSILTHYKSDTKAVTLVNFYVFTYLTIL